jgi:hypothetical protein
VAAIFLSHEAICKGIFYESKFKEEFHEKKTLTLIMELNFPFILMKLSSLGEQKKNVSRSRALLFYFFLFALLKCSWWKN